MESAATRYGEAGTRQESGSPRHVGGIGPGGSGQPATVTIQPGSGAFIKSGGALYSEEDTTAGDRGVTLNLVNVSIDQAAKTIFADILKKNYLVDSRVKGSITLQTTNPISKRHLVNLFETVLQANGAVIEQRDTFYRIVPAAQAAGSAPHSQTGSQGQSGPGVRSEVFPLRYVSADNIQEVLKPILPEGAILRVDGARNLLVISGTGQELATARDTIALFDVDWMRGMSFALFPLKASGPDAIAGELDTIFGTRSGPQKGITQFIPNRRLNAVLVISKRSHNLRRAAHWIQRLDKVATKNEAQLYVYNVQNRVASELAKILQAVYQTSTGEPIGVEQAVAPNFQTTVTSTDTGTEGDTPQASASPVPSTADTGIVGASGQSDAVRIVADDTNNSLLIIAKGKDYKRLVRLMTQIDTVPNQVMLETIIAEVTLTDELKFGLKWMFQRGNNNFTFTDLISGGVKSVFPGFSYTFATDDIRVVLDALSNITHVNVLSSPTIMVLDNRTATLQIGDQVPIITQSSSSVTDGLAPVVNKIEQKDTGVILSVTPRINDNGRIILNIEQEVSDVVPTSSSGIDSPTVRQRKISTTVFVYDGRSIALGGLIQEDNSNNRNQVPVLGDIPILGLAFKSKQDKIKRTELIIFIRPKVMRDAEEARQVTEEYRRQLSLKGPRRPTGRTRMERDFKRILQ